jgi:hypothetical protein
VSEERSDAYILGRLIERSRLLIALSEEIPVETKLQAQPLLKQLEQLLSDPTDGERIHATWGALRAELEDYADLDALLAAMRHFLPPR